MRKKHKLIFLPVILLMINSAAFALNADRSKPIHFAADSVDFNQKLGRGHYVGHVSIDNGSTHLRAATATTTSDSSNKVNVAVAHGNVKIPAHFWTKMSLDKPDVHAYAHKITFYPQTQKVVLEGDTLVVQGKDRFQAPRIEYDMKNQHVVTKGSAKQQTKIVFHVKDGDYKSK